MNTPAPVNRVSALPSGSTVIGAAIGVPAAIVAVWLVQTLAPHVNITPDVSAAFGALFSAFAGYFFNGGKSTDTTQAQA